MRIHSIVEDKEHDCELCANDGFGLISYDLAQQWSEDLKLPSTASGFCVRNAFCKGMLFPFPFREFAKKVAKQNKNGAGKVNMPSYICCV